MRATKEEGPREERGPIAEKEIRHNQRRLPGVTCLQ
jgi:hypothetical protein